MKQKGFMKEVTMFEKENAINRDDVKCKRDYFLILIV